MQEPGMLHDDIQTLVCARLFEDCFPLELGADDASDVLTKAFLFNNTDGQFTRSLRQPAELGRTAGVCKTWHAAVVKHRMTKLLKAVEHMNRLSSNLALYFADNDMPIPFEALMRFKVLLGSRDMYLVQYVRRRDELSVYCVIQTHNDKPTWTSLERHYALHKLCLVSFRTLQPAEQEQYRLWRQKTKEELDMWLTQQYLIFKLRLL